MVAKSSKIFMHNSTFEHFHEEDEVTEAILEVTNGYVEIKGSTFKNLEGI